MTLALTIDAQKLKELMESFPKMKKRFEDVSAIERQLADEIRADVDMRFKSSPVVEVGGAVYGGVQWDRLTDYALFMNPRRRGGRILIDTGELYRGAITPGGANQTKVKGKEFTFELTDRKAIKNHPKRPILVWHDELLEKVSKVYLKHVVGEGER